jgi:hypothetical protein
MRMPCNVMQCRAQQLRQESMDKTKDEEAKLRGEPTPDAAKTNKSRKKAAKQIEPQRLSEVIQSQKASATPIVVSRSGCGPGVRTQAC